MSETFKLQYNNNALAYPGWNGYVCYEKPSGYPITYLSDEHVSVTGDGLYIPGSEGLQLQSSYDPYYRIDYEITNGEIVDGLLIPSGPCTVYAKDTINYFTATGNFEKGSNVSLGATAWANGADGEKSTNVAAKYAVCTNHTGDIPSSWYNTSNIWKPNDASGYSITLNCKMLLTGTAAGYQANGGYMAGTAAATAVCLIGSNQSNSQSWSCGGTPASTRSFNGNYSKTITTTAQNVNYGVSAKLYARGIKYYRHYLGGTGVYVATGTDGTWTATGIAP